MNRLSRLTALLLALLMLFSSTGLAEAAAGIAFDDFNATAFYSLKQSAESASEDAETEDEEEVVYTDPQPLVQCSGTVYDEECFLDAIRGMTEQERMEYVNGLASYYYSHYRTWHEDTKLLCECDFPMPAPDAETGHLFTTCPWHPEYVLEVGGDEGGSDEGGENEEEGVLVDTELEEEVNGASVTVSGSMPEGAQMQVSAVPMTTVTEYLPELATFDGVLALDISIIANEAEWTPENGVTVTVDATSIGANGDAVLVLHTTKNGSAYESDEIGIYTITDGSVTFSMNSFSIVTLVNCSDEDADICILEKLQGMTVAERYAYFTELTENDRDLASTYYWHYSYKHEDTKLLCECYFPLYAPGSADHYDADCAWHPDNLPVDKELGETTEDGTTVTVSGSIPANVTLEVARASASDIVAVVPSASTIQARNVVLDITLVDQNDDVWQPEEAVTVTVNAPNLGVEGDTIVLFHIHGTQVEHIGETEMDANGDITFTMNKFSYIYAVNACDEEGCILEYLSTLTPDARYTYLRENYDSEALLVVIRHYKKMHAQTGLLCNCTMFLAPAADGHVATCAWHKDMLYPPVSGEIDGTTVSVSGGVPKGASLSLAAADLSEVAEYLPMVSKVNNRLISLDLSLVSGSATVQPESAVTVTVSADNLGEDGDSAMVVHTHFNSDGTYEQENVGILTIENGAVTFDVTKFSNVTIVNCSDELDCNVAQIAAMTAEDRRQYFITTAETDYYLAQGQYAHLVSTTSGHLDLNLICTCGFTPMLNYEPGSDEHDSSTTGGWTCPWHSSVYEPSGLTQTLPDGTSVTVSGNVQEDVALSVSTVEESVIKQYIPTIDTIAARKLLLDVKLLDENDVEVQPEGEVQVEISANNLGENGDVIALFHISNGVVEYIGTKAIANGKLTYTTDNFSYVVGVNIADMCTDGEDCAYDAFVALEIDEREAELARMYKADTYHTEYNMFIGHVLSYHGTGAGVCLCVDYHPDTHGYGTIAHTTATDTFNNPIECSWAFKNLTADEQYEIIKGIEDPQTKVDYFETLDETKQAALKDKMTEAEKAEIDFLLLPEVIAWLATGTVTPDMLQRAIEMHTELTLRGEVTFTWSGASRLEGTELIDVYTGVVLADYDPATGELRDRRVGLLVGILNLEDGSIVPPVVDETPEDDETDNGPY